MRAKSLVILAVVTALAVIAAAVSVYQRERSTAVAATPDELFPELLARVNDVAALNVVTPTAGFTIRKQQDGTWRLVEKDGYPVKYETVKQAVVGIASLDPLEPRTAQPKLYHRLRVAEPEPGRKVEGAGILLRLMDGAGQEIAAVIVGKTKSVKTDAREGWYYVREPAEAQSWLAGGRVEVPETAVAWLDNSMIEVARQRVRSAAAVQPGGERASVSRKAPDETNFQVEGIPDGAKPLHDTVGNALGSALGFLSFEDVKPAAEIDFAGAGQAVFRTFDGLVLTASLADLDGGTWARFEAAYDPDQGAMEGLNEAQRKDLKPAEEVQKEAAEINERFGGWAFLLPEHKAKDFKTQLSDLVVFDQGDDGKPQDGKS